MQSYAFIVLRYQYYPVLTIDTSILGNIPILVSILAIPLIPVYWVRRAIPVSIPVSRYQYSTLTNSLRLRLGIQQLTRIRARAGLRLLCGLSQQETELLDYFEDSEYDRRSISVRGRPAHACTARIHHTPSLPVTGDQCGPGHGPPGLSGIQWLSGRGKMSRFNPQAEPDFM